MATRESWRFLTRTRPAASSLASSTLLLLLASAACAADAPETDDSWRGTIHTDGAVTTVRTESGSVWNGTADLVEEASIGVASGPDEYMLGMVSALTATDDRIYVVDAQAPAVRGYDRTGTYVHTLGRVGDGPGEYRQPALVAAHETGRVFVFDSGGRILVYDADGSPVSTWSFQTARCCVWPMYALASELLWTPVQEWLDETKAERRYGVQSVGPSGPVGPVTWVPDLELVQPTFTLREGVETPTPFAPWVGWTPTPEGGLLAGASDRYRVELHRADGSRLVIERNWTPTAIPEAHREWVRRREVAFHRLYNAPGLVWDGAEMPHTKPAFTALIAGRSGSIWVMRFGESLRQPDCVEDPLTEGYREAVARPCWIDELSADVFGNDGRFLGSIPLPSTPWLSPTTLAIDGDRVVGVAQDSEGNVQVKRYRLVPPGDDAGLAGERTGGS